MAIEKIAFITIQDISKRIDLLLIRQQVLDIKDYNMMKDGILQDILIMVIDITKKTDWDDLGDKLEWSEFMKTLIALMLIDINPRELEKPLECNGVCLDDLREEERVEIFSDIDESFFEFNHG